MQIYDIFSNNCFEIVTDFILLFFSFWNNSEIPMFEITAGRSVFAVQMYKTSGYFSLDFYENLRTKLCFYLN